MNSIVFTVAFGALGVALTMLLSFDFVESGGSTTSQNYSALSRFYYNVANLPLKYLVVVFITGWLMISILYGDILIFGWEVKPQHLFLVYAIVIVLLKVGPKYSLAAAAVFIAVSPSLLVNYYTIVAEAMATYSFLLLALGILFLFFDHIKDSPQLLLIKPPTPKPKFHQVRKAETACLNPLPDLNVSCEHEETRLAKNKRLKLEKRRKTAVILMTSFLIGALLIAVVEVKPWKVFGLLNQPVKESKNSAKSMRTSQEARTSDNMSKKSPLETSESKKAAAIKADIEILNGTIIKNEAIATGDELSNKGYNVLRIADADHNDYLQTVVRCKQGYREIATKAVFEIGRNLNVNFQEDINDDEDAEIIIILGSDAAGLAETKVQVLNANGIKGEGAKVSQMILKAGFNVGKAENLAQRNETTSMIRCIQTKKDEAEAISALIEGLYPVEVADDLPDGGTADIVVILGKNRINPASQEHR